MLLFNTREEVFGWSFTREVWAWHGDRLLFVFIEHHCGQCVAKHVLPACSAVDTRLLLTDVYLPALAGRRGLDAYAELGHGLGCIR